MSELEAEKLAILCSETMHADDHAAQMLGMKIMVSTPRYAEVEMAIRPDMLNGHGFCHGGIIFTLADTAFAHACNNQNKLTVGSGCTIDYLLPVRREDVLTAVAVERSRSGRTGLYDVDVKNQDNQVVAVFRGRSHQVKGSLLPEEDNS